MVAGGNGRKEAALYDWPLNDSQLALAAAVGLGVVVITLIVMALRTASISRAEFARLQRDIKQLSEEVKALLAAEQRRFLKELKVSEREGDEPTAAVTTPDADSVPLEQPSIPESTRHPNLQLLKREAVRDSASIAQ
jgi:hypothetical protein